MTDAESPPAAPPQPPALRPWGILATFGWAALAEVTSIVATLAGMIFWHRGGETLPDLTADGFVFSSITIATTVIQTAILVLAAHLPAGASPTISASSGRAPRGHDRGCHHGGVHPDLMR